MVSEHLFRFDDDERGHTVGREVGRGAGEELFHEPGHFLRVQCLAYGHGHFACQCEGHDVADGACGIGLSRDGIVQDGFHQ